jgi:uncharacterized protein with FMN-binding domain
MEEKQTAAYYALLGVTIAFTVLAIVTLLPNPGASKPNVLGYRSVCPFAPSASALCGLLAGITCTLRNRLVSRRASSARYAPPFAPLAAAVALLAVAVIFTVRFVEVQSRFVAVIESAPEAGGAFGPLADGTRVATASEGDISATVEVTIVEGRVEDLKLTAGKNVDASLSALLFQDVIDAQSTAVDAVSGSTASSRVLLQAVSAAATARP